MPIHLPKGMNRVHWLLGGWSVVILIILYFPILLLVLYSFNASQTGVRWEGATTHWYRELQLDWYLDFARYGWNLLLHKSGIHATAPVIASTPALIESLNNSLIAALFTTVLATILGTVGGWMLFRYAFPSRRTISTLVFIPMVVPEVIMGISLRIFFSKFNALTGGHLPLGMWSIIIAHTTFCFPFVMVAVQARLAGLDPALEEAAQDLGATPWQAFLKVIVPYLMPAIVSGALMSFTLSFDEYLVTIFVNSADSRTFPVDVYGRVKLPFDGKLNAISTLFILSTAMLAVGTEWLRTRNR